MSAGRAIGALARPGDRLISRKGHVGYYAGIETVEFPRVATLEALGDYAHRAKANFLYYSWYECFLRPEFSFLLGLPTLGGACVFKLAKNLLTASREGTPNLFEQLGPASVALGVAVAAISAALAVRWLVGFLQRRGLAPFGWYRIALALLVGAALLSGALELSGGRS